jgi:hypothetical protein
MQTSQFKHHIVLHSQIKGRLIQKLISEIRDERNGKVIEKMQIRFAVHLLLEVGIHSRKIYEQEFEMPFLQRVQSAHHRLVVSPVLGLCKLAFEAGVREDSKLLVTQLGASTHHSLPE